MQTGNLKRWLERFYFDVEPNFKGVRDFEIVPVRGLDFFLIHTRQKVCMESPGNESNVVIINLNVSFRSDARDALNNSERRI